MKKTLNIKKSPNFKNPCLICAWPGMGNVAFRATEFLVQSLKATEFASIDGSRFYYPSGIDIENSNIKLNRPPYNKFYFHKTEEGKELIIFLSNAQPDLSKYKEYTKPIFDLVTHLKIKFIFSFAAMPQAIDHMQRSNTWAVTTNEGFLGELKKLNVKILKHGHISGMNGLILGLAKEKSIDGVCILAEIPLYTIHIANPKASLTIINTFKQLLNIRLDTKLLLEETMATEAEINKIVDYLKSSIHPGPIGEEEIENIKLALGKQSRLPDSVRGDIERLFRLAKKDMVKAGELKKLLDRWNIYKDYEDRFLDLFRDPEKKDN